MTANVAETTPIAVTMGDPAGVGGELTLSAWRKLRESGPVFFAVDDPHRLTALARHFQVDLPIGAISSPEEAASLFQDALPVLPIALDAQPTLGAPDVKNAPAILRSIELSVKAALEGDVRAVVTNPIHKKSLLDSGFSHPGHTEFLGALTEAAPNPAALSERGPVMMLAAKDLRVALITIHEPLRRVPALISAERITRTVRTVHQALKVDFGVAAPRIAVAGLNPHAGENGALGSEELEIIAPAIETIRTETIDASGPFPADSLFHDDARARFDAVICMYHDQGLIPLKSLDFYGGVNLPLGLPIVRTSPDHGTAFDIAGKGVARDDSFLNALHAADAIARSRVCALQ